MKTRPSSEPKGRAYRPLLSIEPVAKTVVRKFEIKESAARLISRYAQFMSERGGAAVKEDLVVEHLALLIEKDKGFRDWDLAQGAAPLPQQAGH